ncbi:hypothetical protein LJK88_39910 [Paenibacillus sp. P26]|nr:hypothetical protein LJK88_39910 [Paenibacillus sp. P26]
MLEQYGHGGDLRTAAEAFGGSPERFLDFSSNMNPLGPRKPSAGFLRAAGGRWCIILILQFAS